VNEKKESPMAEMTQLERSLLEDLEILLEDIIDADQHFNPETLAIYPSLLVLCRKIITINTRFALAQSPAIKAVATNGHGDAGIP
jgi:hypothetical protein